MFVGCAATPWANLRLKPADRRNLKQLAKPKGGRAQGWFTLPDDVPCRDLPLEIETLVASTSRLTPSLIVPAAFASLVERLDALAAQRARPCWRRLVRSV